MGGTSYLVPAPYRGMSTRDAHLVRRPPSTEPGTDYYMPIGTPLVAPIDCRVVAVGGGIVPATGRFVTLDDGTRWLRGLHLSRFEVSVGDELQGGRDVFALSGASGYGSEFFGASNPNDPGMLARTGGPHVHMTAFRGRGYTFGAAGTIDFHALTGGVVAGGGSSPSNPVPDEGEDMSYAMRVLNDAGRGPVEITPGFRPNPLNGEEFDNYYGGKAITCSARQYDVNLARALRLIPRDAACFIGRGSSDDRPWTLFAPGYIFPYVGATATELLGNQLFTTVTHTGNDRQYDLWTLQALAGKLPRIDVETVASGNAALSDADVARIAKAARAEFSAQPLTTK